MQAFILLVDILKCVRKTYPGGESVSLGRVRAHEWIAVAAGALCRSAVLLNSCMAFSLKQLKVSLIKKDVLLIRGAPP